MLNVTRLSLLAACVLAASCGSEAPSFAFIDGGSTPDGSGSSSDAGVDDDGGAGDGGTSDGGAEDGGDLDGGVEDGGDPDGGTPDGGDGDGGNPDGGNPDGGNPDGGNPDAGARCGDGNRDAGELCDGDDLGGQSCAGLGFDGGELGCNDSCDGYDFEACESDTPVDPVCGNGVREPGELCDGADVGVASCADFGYDAGELRCSSDCGGYSFAGCTREACVPECGARECGLDPVCGESCGSCETDLEFCDSDGRCQPATGRPPRFITFDSNVRRITEGEAVRFTAVVTDPDGIDDLIGGTLRDPVSRGTYGSFTTSAAEGSYQIEVTWADVQFVRPIDFTRETMRAFEAEFFDQDGNRVVDTINVTLYCDDGDIPAACNGQCRDLSTLDDCGACDNECIPNAVCTGAGDRRSCGCPDGWAECGGECVDLSSDDHCGECFNECDTFGGGFCNGDACACPEGQNVCASGCSYDYESDACGVACDVCSDGEYCNGTACETVSDGDLRMNAEWDTLEVYHEGEWRGVCDDSFDMDEAVVACRQLGGTLVTYSLNQRGASSEFWLDDLGCDGSERRLDACAGADYGSENCGISEGVRVICEPGGLPDCDPAPIGSLVINEIIVDGVGADGVGANEFVEIAGPPGADLSGVELVFYNGSDNTEYERIVLPDGTTMPGDGFFVIGGANVANTDRRLSFSPQNGHDWVRIETCLGEVGDGLGYGNPIIFANEFGEGSWEPVPLSGWSIGRDEFSTDTNDNASDFRAFETPTPGAPNVGSSGGTLELPISETLSTDSTAVYNRPNQDCIGGSSGHYYASSAFTNTGSSPVTVTITAEHDADGYLHVYSDSFSPSSPLTNCVVGNDDYTGIEDSRVDSIFWGSGETIVVVISTYSPGDRVESVVTIEEAAP